MIEKLLSAPIVEQAVNAALNLDPQAAEKLNEIDGVRISIHLDFSSQPWTFTVDNSRLCFVSIDSADCDVRLRGTLGGFLHAFRGDGKPTDADKLYIEGDLHSAQQFQRVMAELEPDFETVLQKQFGEKLGGIAAGVLSQIRLQGEQTRDKVESVLREWVSGENGQFVSHSDFAEQKQRLTDLMAQLERVEARLAELEKF